MKIISATIIGLLTGASGLMAGSPQSMAPAPLNEGNPFYVELSGGYASTTLGSPERGSTKSGRNFNGRTYNHDLDMNEIFGVKLGYQASETLRFDIGYFMTGGDISWDTNFGSSGMANFHGDLAVDLFLASGYYSFQEIRNFTPYVGVSVGFSRNKFSSLEESSAGVTYAYPEANTETNLAYKLSVGTDYRITDNFTLNLDLSLVNIGDFSTGNKRTYANGIIQPIGAYEFDDTWFTSLSLGVRYNF